MESPRERSREMCDGPPLELAPGIYQLTLPMPFRLNHVHVYLVEADDGFLLIDTGMNTPEAFSGLTHKLDYLGLDFKAITQIMITHFHSDHCGQAARIHALGGAQIVMGSIERDTLAVVQASPNDEREASLQQHGLPPEQAKQHAEVLPYLKSLSTPFEADLLLEPGHTLLAKHRRLEAIVTPGHTPGHVCLFLPEEKIMFSGDHILQKITPNISLHSYSGHDPLGEYLNSLRATLVLGAECLLPSHGMLVEDPERRIHELLQHHARRLESCLEVLGPTAMTAYEVSQLVFDTALDAFGSWMALGETLSHLEHLVHQELLSKTDDGDCVRYARL